MNNVELTGVCNESQNQKCNILNLDNLCAEEDWDFKKAGKKIKERSRYIFINSKKY